MRKNQKPKYRLLSFQNTAYILYFGSLLLLIFIAVYYPSDNWKNIATFEFSRFGGEFMEAGGANPTKNYFTLMFTAIGIGVIFTAIGKGSASDPSTIMLLFASLSLIGIGIFPHDTQSVAHYICVGLSITFLYIETYLYFYPIDDKIDYIVLIGLAVIILYYLLFFFYDKFDAFFENTGILAYLLVCVYRKIRNRRKNTIHL